MDTLATVAQIDLLQLVPPEPAVPNRSGDRVRVIRGGGGGRGGRPGLRVRRPGQPAQGGQRPQLLLPQQW